MFDKFLCEHIQKVEISLLDVLAWGVNTTLFSVIAWAGMILFAAYSALDLYSRTNSSNVLLPVGFIEIVELATVLAVFSVLVTWLFDTVVMSIKAAFNMKIAHCPNTEYEQRDKEEK